MTDKTGLWTSTATMAPRHELRGGRGASAWNVRQWGKRAWGIVCGVAIAIIVVVAVVAVVESNKARANRYPDYTKLNYSLSDTCKLCNRGILLANSTGLL